MMYKHRPNSKNTQRLTINLNERIQTMKSIRKILENNGFAITKTKDGYELERYTPAGEDWLIYLSKLKDLKEYAENFNPEEEFEMWIEAKRNGVAGVPGVSELWQDQLWKQEILNKIIGELN